MEMQCVNGIGASADHNHQKNSMDVTNKSSSSSSLSLFEAAAAVATTMTKLTGQTRWSKVERNCIIALHCCQFGALWRYAKLFVPVDLWHVKHEVLDLCMLRLVRVFWEAAPMLLLHKFTYW